jgi:hypothetical protein
LAIRIRLNIETPDAANRHCRLCGERGQMSIRRWGGADAAMWETVADDALRLRLNFAGQSGGRQPMAAY